MFIGMPYFMDDDDWYYYDAIEKKYVLTVKAPKKAKESYDEYYAAIKENEKRNNEMQEKLVKSFIKGKGTE